MYSSFAESLPKVDQAVTLLFENHQGWAKDSLRQGRRGDPKVRPMQRILGVNRRSWVLGADEDYPRFHVSLMECTLPRGVKEYS